MDKIVIAYYLILNLGALFLYAMDKFLAEKNAYRIPEKVLLGLALAGGGVGALFAMYCFRHKTRHLNFRIIVPLSAFVHIFVWWLILR